MDGFEEDVKREISVVDCICVALPEDSKVDKETLCKEYVIAVDKDSLKLSETVVSVDIEDEDDRGVTEILSLAVLTEKVD